MILTIDISEREKRQNRAIFNPRFEGLVDLCEYLGDTKNMIMIEVGSAVGESAEVFAQYFKTVYCVDPFLNQENEIYFDKRVQRFNNVIKIKDWSSNACLQFKEPIFDFVYLDADHSYQGTKDNINDWLRLVKGPYIGGHDFSVADIQVIRAVLELFGIPEKIFCDWSWVVKNV